MSQINIQEAADILNHHGLVIYPTETFFGIGCKISSESAIANIFRVKHRLYAMPLPIVIADTAQMHQIAAVPSDFVHEMDILQKNFWPGPLTIILPAKANISDLLTGGTGKIALRVSLHPVPTALARLVGEPIVASSANISGQPPATSFEQLNSVLIQATDAVLDLPPAPAGGAPSTLIEIAGPRKLKLHRAGAVSIQALQQFGFSMDE